MDRFYRKLQARQSYVDQQKVRENSRTSLERPVEELNLGTRPTAALVNAGIKTVGQIIEKLAIGEQALLDVEGFGRKSLIDLKKHLRQQGYELPAAADDIVV
ncbi:MAG TPA: DNA-directed RNA polymerase subunit alpha C-terminal domain-containing protein [Anaerolineaceae bacterium]|nr:DNA-directed RNA polymerase subunit alpha C-terminal domain-containing protein [Anaerolineaceae bacterium]